MRQRQQMCSAHTPSNELLIERQVLEKASRIRVELLPCLATTSPAIKLRISTGSVTIALV